MTVAFDIVRGFTTPKNWSRGNDVGSVGVELSKEGRLGKTLTYGAVAGAGAMLGWLLWKRYYKAKG